jgi:hypothetical protein
MMMSMMIIMMMPMIIMMAMMTIIMRMMMMTIVQPAVGRRGELGNDCFYLYHSSRGLDILSPLALALISPIHTPELMDNLYLTGVY